MGRPAPHGRPVEHLDAYDSTGEAGDAANGEAIFGAGIATRVLGYFSAEARAAPAPFPQLTDRECEVLELVAQGRSNTAIATRLHLNQKTIRNNVSNILAKLQVADRAQAIVRARDVDLGHQPTADRNS